VPSNEKSQPKFLRRLNQNMIFKLDKTSFADNFGKVYIPLNIEPGEYKIYY